MDSEGVLWRSHSEGLPRGFKGLWEILFGLPDTDTTIISHWLAHWLATQMAGLGTWPIEFPPPAESPENKKKKRGFH